MEYETSEVLQSYADEFKTTENNKYIAQQKEINDKNYIFVSTKMGEDKTIVYIEDIASISAIVPFWVSTPSSMRLHAKVQVLLR